MHAVPAFCSTNSRRVPITPPVSLPAPLPALQVRLDSGQVITASRTLAVIYYLTRDWRPEYGGVLLDLEDPRVGT